MLDTVKLSFDTDAFEIMGASGFGYTTELHGIRRAVRNPSRKELWAGLYLPRVTLINRPTQQGRREQLTVEFSAPKMIFGNNFDELEDSDFQTVVKKLQESLKYIGVGISMKSISNAKVVCWHPSKNIILDNCFGCQTVINTLKKVDYSRVYSIQKTDFQDGEVMHFHCNSKDIAFYDKLADLRQAKTSDKRSRENDSQIQIDLLEQLNYTADISVLRYEIRLNGARAIKQNFKHLPTDELVFNKLFRSRLSKQLLEEYWRVFEAQIDYLSLDVNKPFEILQNYLKENKDITPQAALAAVAGLYITNQQSTAALRSTLDKRFGKHYWYRYKPTMKKIQGRRYNDITQITNSLHEFQPTRMEILINRVD